jgi:hypothetical protein
MVNSRCCFGLVAFLENYTDDETNEVKGLFLIVVKFSIRIGFATWRALQRRASGYTAFFLRLPTFLKLAPEKGMHPRKKCIPFV